MKAAITIFIFLIIASLSQAQGTYTDTVTGMTIDYSSDWKHEKIYDEIMFYGTHGNIKLTKTVFDLPFSNEEFILYAEDNPDKYLEVYERISNGRMIVRNSGRTKIGNVDAYFTDILVDREDDVSDVYRRARITLTIYDNYLFNFITYPFENMYDEMIADTEEFLGNVRFP